LTTARDNVVFELGLFIGRLGRERTFIVMPKGVADFHLPSDLLGVRVATYQAPASVARLQAALGPACHDVRLAIRSQLAAQPASDGRASADVDLVLPLVIPAPEREHLLNIASGRTNGYEGRESLRSELRHLRTIGLIEKINDRNIGDLKSGERHDLAEFVRLTDLGKQLAAKLQKRS
jgi:hypothetical protein